MSANKLINSLDYNTVTQYIEPFLKKMMDSVILRLDDSVREYLKYDNGTDCSGALLSIVVSL